MTRAGEGFWTEPGFEAATDRDRLDVLLRGLRGTAVVQRPVEFAPARRRAVVNEFLEHVHGHAGAVTGWRFALLARDEVSLVGVAVGSRAVGPGTDPDRVLEVSRLALLEGAPRNLASQLLGRLCRAAAALGFERVQTWLLAEEAGTCYRAAGFELERTIAGALRSRRGRPRLDDERNAEIPKTLWSRELAA